MKSVQADLPRARAAPGQPRRSSGAHGNAVNRSEHEDFSCFSITEDDENLLAAIVFQVMYVVARKFGFQTFNLQRNATVQAPDGSVQKGDRWVEATAFLATDHLCQLLIIDGLPREDPQTSGTLLAFSRSIWRLHARIFAPYKTWASHQRIIDDFPEQQKKDWWDLQNLDSFQSVIVGLLDLCLYFGMYSEAANLKHMPEAMWFVFWCMRCSKHFEQLLMRDDKKKRLLYFIDPFDNPNSNFRDRMLLRLRKLRVDLRNTLADDIEAARKATSLGLPGTILANEDTSGEPLRLFDGVTASTDFSCKKWSESGEVKRNHVQAVAEAKSVAKSWLRHSHDCDISEDALLPLLVDLIALGDGGRFTERVVTPPFEALAFEIALKGGSGVEPALRITYDDANESFVEPQNVRHMLEHLKGSPIRNNDKLAIWAPNVFKALCNLGLSNTGWSSKSAMEVYKGTNDKPGWFIKTYQERRTWMALFRAYFRVFAFHILLFHAMLAVAFEDKSNDSFTGRWWLGLSSLVITHAVLEFLYGYAGLYIKMRVQPPPAANRRRRKTVEFPGWRGQALHLLCCPFPWLRVKLFARGRNPTEYEGFVDSGEDLQMWHVHTLKAKRSRLSQLALGLFWLAILVALIALYVLQFAVAENGTRIQTTKSNPQFFEDIWIIVASVYGAVTLILWVISMRDGYVVNDASFTSILSSCWSGVLRVCGCGVYGAGIFSGAEYIAMPPRVGWRRHILNVLFWSIVLVIKGAFDYFLVVRNLVDPIRGLLNVNWFGSCGDDLVIGGGNVPCVENMLLVGVLCLPAFLVVLVDTAVFYQIGVFIYGCTNGMFSLGLGQITNWNDLVKEMAECVDLFNGKMLTLDAQTHWKKAETIEHYFAHETRVQDTIMLRQGTIKARHEDKAPDLQADTSKTQETGKWVPFRIIWDRIIEELQSADLLSADELTNLQFTLVPALQSYGLRPLVLPAAFFAGRVQAAMDCTSSPDTATVAILSDMYSLMLVLVSELGLLDPGSGGESQFQILSQLRLLPSAQSAYHLSIRVALVAAIRTFVAKLRALIGNKSAATELPNDIAKQFAIICLHLQVEVTYSRSLYDQAGVKGGEKMQAIYNALKKILYPGAPSTNYAISVARLDTSSASTQVASEKPSLMNPKVTIKQDSNFSNRLRELDPMCTSPESRATTRTRNIERLVEILHRAFTLSEEQAAPRNEEATRVLRFFMSSLFNPQLRSPRPLHQMMSLTTLVPHYAEDVIYALDADEVERRIRLKPSAAEMGDLVSPMQGYEVTTMEYLRIVSQEEWENFVERMAKKHGVKVKASAVTEADFTINGGGPFADIEEARMDLMLWASNRGQLLARTTAGMMLYERALQLLAELDMPEFMGCTDEDKKRRLQRLISSKFRHIVSSQVYGEKRASNKPKDLWLAYTVEHLLAKFPTFRVAYIDKVKQNGSPGSGHVYYSVLMRWDSALGCASEEYRVRLPSQTQTNRGVVIGEGKPENQNHAAIFCFSESLQTVDMNQENRLAEAIKMRNLLSEFRPATRRSAPEPTNNNIKMFRKGVLSNDAAAPPVALVGFREWIFSASAGALGAFAAGAEFAFGTIVQRTMDNPGGARFHYGHPDVWNKLFTMTRGGVSKATRAFHVSEDVFGGYNAVFRGARIKYREYISVGKARDVGFEQINGFESKVAGGNGEQLISRDAFRLGSRFDWFRLMSWYHSGIGFFMNTTFVMASVYLSVWVLFVFALADTLRVNVTLANPDLAVPVVREQIVIPAINSIQIVQLGFLSIIPYWGELCLEAGFISGSVNIMRQMLAGSLLFFIFRQQTSAYYFSLIAYYGGAKYIATGRGFALTHSSYVKLFTAFGRSHMYMGYQLALLAIMLLVLDIPSYFLSTWGTWLVALSLFFSPFWFNPLSFDTTQVYADFLGWRRWMLGNSDADTKESWFNFHRATMEKPRNLGGQQTDHGYNRLGGVMMQFFNIVIFIAVGERLLDPDREDVVDPDTGELVIDPATGLPQRQDVDGSVRRKVIGIIIFEALLIFFIALLGLQRLLHNRGQRFRRFISVSFALSSIAMFVLFLTIFGKDASTGFADLLLLAFANFTLGTIAVQLLLYITPFNDISSALVDTGYFVTDTVIGYITFAWLFVLALLPVVDTIQGTLLFNYEFLKESRAGQQLKSLLAKRRDTDVVTGAPKPVPPAPPAPDVGGAVSLSQPPASAALRQRRTTESYRGGGGGGGDVEEFHDATLPAATVMAPMAQSLQPPASAALLQRRTTREAASDRGSVALETGAQDASSHGGGNDGGVHEGSHQQLSSAADTDEYHSSVYAAGSRPAPVGRTAPRTGPGSMQPSQQARGGRTL